MKKYLKRMHDKMSWDYTIEEHLVSAAVTLLLIIALIISVAIFGVAVSTRTAWVLLFLIPSASLSVFAWSIFSYINKL